jgi:hypothetical protein
MTMGLQDLMMFRDNLQQPEPTGMDNLRSLQALTMQGMSAENYMNEQQQPMMNTGLMSLPVAQAGFGGFIKRITSIPRAIVRTVKRVAKSPLGKLAITAAPMFLGLPPIVANPALNAAIYSGGTTLLTGGKPEDALKSAIISGGLTGLTSPTGFKTPEGSKGLFSGAKTTPSNLNVDAPTYTSKLDASTARSYSGGPSLSPDVNVTSAYNVPLDPDALSATQNVNVLNAAESQKALETARLGAPPPSIGERISDFASTALDKTQAALKAGVQFAKDKPIPTALGAAALLSGLGAGQQIPQQQLAMAGLTPVETDFDKQVFTYKDRQGNILTRDEALRMIQQASQNVGAGGQKVASGVTYDINRIKSGGPVDPVLSASGGLIGMMYGGQAMPENNMDVKYKEFSGMVGGRGDGMEDNVYMPIVEGESGQQVATLAVSPKEYVVDANTMSLLGNGNPDEGAEIMDKTVKDIRKKATGQTKQQKEIDGLAALNRMRRSV